ncbi:MAG: YggS family pyridoxal phosphate-dependent enzyme [Gammaproteobacteria bacterium]|nr:YggS family pyridoxal phosphate-dependent enzyme [Gammaproteobacteria bacterium]
MNMGPDTNQTAGRYRHTVERLREYSRRYGRDADSIRLIAVSKRHPAEEVAGLARLGHRDFAENFLQEAVEKINLVADLLSPDHTADRTKWHFIGHIQSRKCKLISQYFDWVHTIDSLKVAQKLNRYRENHPPLNVLVQLNLQHEATKSGVTAERVSELSKCFLSLPNLKFRGLMILPKIESDFEKQRAVFRECRETLERLNAEGHELDQLSMGMTADLEAAIAEGATQVRIGTAIFGPRPN